MLYVHHLTFQIICGDLARPENHYVEIMLSLHSKQMTEKDFQACKKAALDSFSTNIVKPKKTILMAYLIAEDR